MHSIGCLECLVLGGRAVVPTREIKCVSFEPRRQTLLGSKGEAIPSDHCVQHGRLVFDPPASQQLPSEPPQMALLPEPRQHLIRPGASVRTMNHIHRSNPTKLRPVIHDPLFLSYEDVEHNGPVEVDHADPG
jgi:hypothetical protein